MPDVLDSKTSNPLTPKEADDRPRLLNTRQTASFLKISVGRVYVLAQSGRLRFFRPGKQILFRESDLLDYLNSGEGRAKGG